MFRGRLGGPLTVLHPESVTTTPLSTIWNNAFFTAAPFSFFTFLLFPFPFSFFLFLFPFSFFLPLFLPFPFSLSLLLSTTCSRDHLKSLIFTFLVLDPFFSFCINFSSVWWMLPTKIVIFLFRFSLFPSRICIGRAWLFFSYRLTSFSALFLIWNKKCLISFSSKPTTANMALLCFLSSGFFDNSKSFLSDIQLTCIWMSGASGLGNLTNVHLIRKKWY